MSVPPNVSAVPDNAESAAPVDSAVLIASAERELGAFMKVVTDTFGPKEARLAAYDWIDELDSRQSLPVSGTHDWRSLTAAAASRLARRLNAGCPDSDCYQVEEPVL